jgi:hypothetical protein
MHPFKTNISPFRNVAFLDYHFAYLKSDWRKLLFYNVRVGSPPAPSTNKIRRPL